MATDYDAPRQKDADAAEVSLEELTGRSDPDEAALDVDDGDLVDGVDLPGADLSDEELTVRVVPLQFDEFTCSRCFLVQHRHRLAAHPGGDMVCADCA